MSDFIQRTWEKLIADGIALEDAAALINRAYGLALDSMAFSDGSTPEYRFNESVQDGFGLLPAVLLRSIIGAVIGDSLCLSVSVELDGEVWECWVLNTNRFHPSIYSGFNFNSYAIYEGRAYGCKSDGIYELTGQADGNEVIRTGVVLPETRFGSTQKKRFRYAFLGIAGDAPIIKVENEDDYAFYRIENNKTTIDRSLSGKIWTFSVMDFEELKYIELLPVVLTR